jgi:hypothetical protein
VRGIEEAEGLIRVEGKSGKPISYNKYGSLAVVVFKAKERINGRLPITVLNADKDLYNVEIGEGTFLISDYFKEEPRLLSLGKAIIVRDGTLRIPIEVSNAFNMKSFGLELTYSADKMLFLGITRGSLAKDFLEVEGNEFESGKVRVGGYGMSAIQEMGPGVLVELIFYVREMGGEIEINKLVDDLVDSFLQNKIILIK